MNKPEIEYPPSQPGLWILSNAVHGEIRESALTALEEEFYNIAAQNGSGSARLWFWGQVVKSIPFFLFDRFWWAFIMTRAYLIVAWRDLKKHKVFTAINIFGLSTGLACGILALLFVQNELSFDRYHENADNIYRIVCKRTAAGREDYYTNNGYNLKALILDNFPEVQNAARLDFYRSFIVEYGEKRFYSDILYADPSLLEIFSFPLVKGDKRTALESPNNVVLSEDMSSKIFGKEDPIGKTIITYYEEETYPLQVSGILKNVPKNSHFQINILIPIEHLAHRYLKEPQRLNSCATYVLLKPGTDPIALEHKYTDLIKRFMGSRAATSLYFLQPLTSIYLHSENIFGQALTSRPIASLALSAIAFLILLIACFNFMNLSTARASRRFREIGQRRVIGAARSQLFTQILGESLFLSFLSLIIGIALARFLLPVFNSMISRNVPLEAAWHTRFLIGFLILAAITGIFSGIYPALVLSSFKPVDVLKGQMKKGRRFEIGLRKSLILIQYFLSIVFIVATILVNQQVHFIQKRDLGFSNKNIVWVSILRDPNLAKSPQAIKEALEKNPNVEKAIVTFQPAGVDPGVRVACQPEGFGHEDQAEMSWKTVGEGFFGFFGIEILNGRDFSDDNSSDARSAVILNESAARFLRWTEPLGKTIRCDWIERSYKKPGPYSVIGVVKDFHNGSLQERIQPTIYIYEPSRLFCVLARISPKSVPDTLAFMERSFNELGAVQPFEPQFLDDYLIRNFYQSAWSVRRVLAFAAFLCLTLSLLGVIGLVSYSTDRRRKEIGIRRVLGASPLAIVKMISMEFMILVLLGGAISLPASLWIGRFFLKDFAYRTEIAWWPFFLSPLIVLMVSLLTVGTQSSRAAAMNPADTLRHE